MSFFIIVYDVGFLVAWVALYQRVDFPGGGRWREFLLPNLWWFGLMVVKMFGWPVTLGLWLYNGRGPSPWKAVTQLDGREVRRIVRVSEIAGA